MDVKAATAVVYDFHLLSPSTAVNIEGLVQQTIIGYSVLRASHKKGATICGAPGRWGPSKLRALGTKVTRPPFASRMKEILYAQFSSF